MNAIKICTKFFLKSNLIENSDKPVSNGVDSAGGAQQPAKNEPVNNTNCEYEESEVSDLNEQQRYNLKHRELYYSKYTDTIAATTIRAKCSVLLFNEGKL